MPVNPSLLHPAVVIRPWREDEAAELSAAVSESIEHLRPWMPWALHEPVSLAERRAQIAAWNDARRAGGDLVFGMFVAGDIVGGCGLHRRIDPGGLAIGYWVHAAHTRRGYATHAAVSLTSLAFSYRDIERVEIHVDAGNTVSAAIPRKLGFTRVAQVAVPASATAETGTHDVWRMHRAEWFM